VRWLLLSPTLILTWELGGKQRHRKCSAEQPRSSRRWAAQRLGPASNGTLVAWGTAWRMP
jgi:hypothetical protein